MRHKSIRQLAKEIGVSASYLSQVNNGKRPASKKLLSISSFKVLSSVKQNVKQQVDTSSAETLKSERAGESSSGRTADSGFSHHARIGKQIPTITKVWSLP